MRSEPSRAGRLLAVSVLAALITGGCNPGAYPIDIFPEMHYQPSQRLLEPDRLAPPADAVPVTGGRPEYTYDEAAGLTNPVPRNAETLAGARLLYDVNCAVCHGADGRGQGAMAEYYARARATAVLPPTDLASDRVRNRTDGELYWLVTHGIGNMPPFRQLLTEEQTWLVVHFIRDVQGE